MTEHTPVIIIDSNQDRIRRVTGLLGPLKSAAFPTPSQVIMDEFLSPNSYVFLVSYDMGEDMISALLDQVNDSNFPHEVIVYFDLDNHALTVKMMKMGAYHCCSLFHLPGKALQNKVENALDKNHMKQKLQKIIEKEYLDDHSVDGAFNLLRKLTAKRLLEGRSVLMKEMVFLMPLSKMEDSIWGEFKRNIQKHKTVEAKYPHDRPTVMAVDDNEGLLENYQDILCDTYNVLLATNGDEALEHANKMLTIDVILLDIQMPGIKGDELLPILKKEHPDSEVIVITGFKQTDIAVNVLSNGAYTYINKPFEYEDLEATIEDAIQAKFLKKFLTEVGELPSIEDETSSIMTQVKEFTAFYRDKVRNKDSVYMKDVLGFLPTVESIYLKEDEAIPSDISDDEMIFWLAKAVRAK